MSAPAAQIPELPDPYIRISSCPHGGGFAKAGGIGGTLPRATLLHFPEILDETTDSEAIYRSYFAVKASSPEAWRHSAAELLSAARLVRPAVEAFWRTMRARAGGEVDRNTPLPHTFQGVYFMLVAYAIENLLKAQLAERYAFRVSIEESGELPDFLRGHKLNGLARRAGLETDDREKNLLLRLERSSVWYGRYPVPLSASDMGVMTLPGGRQVPVGWFGGGDLEALDS